MCYGNLNLAAFAERADAATLGGGSGYGQEASRWRPARCAFPGPTDEHLVALHRLIFHCGLVDDIGGGARRDRRCLVVASPLSRSSRQPAVTAAAP